VHELSIAQNILDIAERHLPAGNLSRVTVIRVRVGALSSVVPESLEFCFDAITPGTRLEGAHLAIDRVPLSGVCPACGRRGSIAGALPLCPACGAAVDILEGDDLHVTEMEVAD
jgi:hydrogenase nickel incorporation protein HypA/HybF